MDFAFGNFVYDLTVGFSTLYDGKFDYSVNNCLPIICWQFLAIKYTILRH